MEILAGLIELPLPNILPAPWYNRPPLGLVSGTSVNVSLVESTSRRQSIANGKPTVPPDIIVTPLKIDRLASSISITIDFEESEGVINRVLSVMESKFNIALMETVTIDQRTKHRICMILEPKESDADPKIFEDEVREFQRIITESPGHKGFFRYQLSNEDISFRRPIPSVVEDEQIRIDEIRNKIDADYGHLSGQFDFSKVVVSSNSDARFIRYIFPRKGSFEVSIPHADRPSAMQRLAAAISELNYNILLSRISKSGPFNKDQSITVAICEPRAGEFDSDLESIREKIKTKLITDDNDIFSFRIKRLVFGRKPSSAQSRMARRSDTKLVHIPEYYMPHILKYRDEKRTKIFVSRPTFRDDDEVCKAAVKEIYDAIEDFDAVVYDGYDRPFPKERPDAFEIHSRIWSSDAAIFLCIGPGGESDWLSRDQEIEWGVASVITRKILLCGSPESFSKRRLMMPESIGIAFGNISDINELIEFRRELRARIGQMFDYGGLRAQSAAP